MTFQFNFFYDPQHKINDNKGKLHKEIMVTEEL